jgi:putative hydrolase of the HAD superfamily
VTQSQRRYALFDVDDTLYAKSAGVMDIVRGRISAYMALRLRMDEETIRELRTRYWRQHGSTMRGLILEFGIDPDDYLSYVHDFSVAGLLSGNERLGSILSALPWHRFVLTSATAEHAQQVLAALGVRDCFERVFDIRATAYVGKPHPAAYQHVLAALGIAAEDCVAIDDSMPNLRTAREMGMITVLVSPTERADGVDFTIGGIEEVAAVAQQIAADRSPRTGSGTKEGIQSHA